MGYMGGDLFGRVGGGGVDVCLDVGLLEWVGMGLIDWMPWWGWILMVVPLLLGIGTGWLTDPRRGK